ncbi:SCO family protein [Granulicella arctica]|uniref:SCO family protein n=1 Tax=Granulicella arctica TaxID=940613 RepID=UPI0021E0EDF4|nr:SCO family protein [Granulicella arctica]
MISVAATAQLMDANKPLGAAAQGELPQYLKDAGVEQRLNQPLPLATGFADEAGTPVTLGSLLHGRPIALALVYFKCKMLCPQVLHGMEAGLNASGFAAGKDFDVVVASIDPTDTPADARAAKLEFLSGTALAGPEAASGVHFLTGQAASIAALSAATGFHYVRVPGPDGKLDQFAHSSVVMFATPDGRLSEYLSGIDYPARDVRLALVNASGRKIATMKDLVLLYCCNYVPSAGRYTVAVLRILSFAGMLMLVGMLVGFYFLARSSRETDSGAAA